MLSFTNEVMYKQLRDWMIYGNLNDKYEEFFICHDKDYCLETESQTTKEDSDLTEIDNIFSSLRFSSSYSQFKINSFKLPSYISIKIANKILFTGELLQIFQVSFK
jgi:gamma-tubulin complex component 4